MSGNLFLMPVNRVGYTRSNRIAALKVHALSTTASDNRQVDRSTVAQCASPKRLGRNETLCPPQLSDNRQVDRPTVAQCASPKRLGRNKIHKPQAVKVVFAVHV